MNKKSIGSAGRWIAGVVGVAAALALAACGGGGGGGTATAAPQGMLQVAITDAPACYDSVLVTIAKVRVQMDDAAGDNDAGWKEIVPPNGPVQVDLVKLTNGQLADLGSLPVDAGTYHQLRLVLAPNTTANPLANAVKPVGGTLQPLTTPSAQQSGLKVKLPFDVQANATNSMVLDFDACKSIVQAGASGQYILKPVLRLGPKLDSGIQGYVATTLSPDTVVYAEQNGAVVRATVPDANGKFTLAFLPSGSYSVVVSSNGYATGVVENVPVGTTQLALNTSTTAITLPTSAMNTVSGTVTVSTTSGSTTTTAPVDDGTVVAQQTVNSNPVEVNRARVDDDYNGFYTMQLPVAAPVHAPYSTSGLTFTADATNAGKYTLKATAEGQAAKTQTVDVSGGAATVNFAY